MTDQEAIIDWLSKNTPTIGRPAFAHRSQIGTLRDMPRGPGEMSLEDKIRWLYTQEKFTLRAIKGLLGLKEGYISKIIGNEIRPRGWRQQ